MDSILKILNEYPSLYCGNNVGNITNYEHVIDTGDSLPISCSPAKTSPEKARVIDAECERLLSKGIIRLAGATPWASRIVLVKRKDGRRRLCCDYRLINKVTRRDCYPLPNINFCIEHARGAKYYTSIDLNESFHQIPIAESSKEKTAFVTPSGKFYKFNCLPFGLCNSPSSFCRALDLILSRLKPEICVTYVDDVLIFAKTLLEHNNKLEKVLQKLAQSNVTIGLNKCLFGLDRIIWGGREISSEGIHVPQKYTSAVLNFPTPQNLRDLRSFLGLSNYSRQYI